MCLDLNLYARGDSLDEARQKLHGFIYHYVESALTKDREYAADLLPRRAPFGFWAQYYCFGALLWFSKQVAKILYKETLPLQVAPA